MSDIEEARQDSEEYRSRYVVINLVPIIKWLWGYFSERIRALGK